MRQCQRNQINYNNYDNDKDTNNNNTCANKIDLCCVRTSSKKGLSKVSTTTLLTTTVPGFTPTALYK